MCGLVALIHAAGPADLRLAIRMADAIAHRGPDDAGEHADGGVALAHRRLSIIDLDGGRQPMTVEGVTVAFNGEIYNYVELREDLVARGHAFRTASDTEVLLRAYLEYGEDAVARLDGMFAFVLHDPRRSGCLVARDPFGVKPLYWARTRDRLAFASEIKALLVDPAIARRVDPAALDDYLSLQFVLGERTLFDGVHKLAPGRLQWIDTRTLAVREHRYWQRRFPGPDDRDGVPGTDALRELTLAAVRRQLRSDVPLGAYLSGGLDSSLVAAAASRTLGRGVDAFTGAFREGPEFDETAHARRVAEHVGSDLHVLYPTEDDWIARLPALVRAMDEPAAGPGLFPQAMVSELARTRVTVCLGGQGGDELFGGYARYLIGALEQAIEDATSGRPVPAGHVGLAELERGLGTLAAYAPLMRTAWRDGLHAPAWRRYFRLVDRSGAARAWIAPALRDDVRREAVAERFRAIYEAPRGCTPVQRMLEFDLATSLPALLQVEDRVSMAVGLESRVPLLDPALAQAAARLPDTALLRGGRLKAVLREIAAPLLPASIVDRPDKMGFPVPLQHWARGRAREFVRDLLTSRRCRERGLFDVPALERLIDDEQAFGRALWGALQLELWHREMIDDDSGRTLRAA